MEVWVDYYSVLQVRETATQEDIRASYKRLCKKYHPDINPSFLASEMMKRVNIAYGVLGDEAARREYHTRWLARSPWKRPVSSGAEREKDAGDKSPSAGREKKSEAAPPPPPSPGRESAQKEDRPSGEPRQSPGEGTFLARKVISDYFTALSGGRLGEAFGYVSGEDKKSFDFDSFSRWQESVSAIYQLGSFSIKLFKIYKNIDLSGRGHRAEEYTVSVVEKNKNTGRVSEYSFTKHAILEGEVWRVYLGYRDLIPLMKQFNTIASTEEEARILTQWEHYRLTTDLETGLPNDRGLAERLEPEIYRYKRYGRAFSVGIVQAFLQGQQKSPENPAIKSGEKTPAVVKFIGYVLKSSVRVIDSVAYLGEGRFAVVFAETNKKAASYAARRILKTVRHDVGACFDFEPDIKIGVAAYGGEDIAGILEACGRVIAGAGGSTDAAAAR